MIRAYSERGHLGLPEYVFFEKSIFLKKIDFLTGGSRLSEGDHWYISSKWRDWTSVDIIKQKIK